MFAGHLGVALAAARVEPRVNVGVLAAASVLLDLLLWLFILFGWESVTIPADFAQTHQAAFDFPYSHGLVAAALWSAAAALLAGLAWRGRGGPAARVAGLVAAVVFSHWLLDVLVHRPELPVLAAGSHALGLSLWNHLGTALAIEAALVVAGLLLYLPGCGLARARRLGLAGLILLVLAFTVVGMTMAPPPPSAAAMAASSLGTLVIVCALLGWLGSGTPRRPA